MAFSYNWLPIEVQRLVGIVVGAASRSGLHGRARVTRNGKEYTIAIIVNEEEWTLSDRERKRRAREVRG